MSFFPVQSLKVRVALIYRNHQDLLLRQQGTNNSGPLQI
jgi:hypothetical protein